ncbi:MAG: nickel ABC transporter permease subunit NikC [Pseudodesulfovibrio sp.]|uniref:Binding-protein-dependent transport systems inner membrane component n=1 Tax=Pseudodesulfovibrio aespoeensis (strain ATCC 700646 / DSM 10631 / Aspo-2) TaxID=643562 RepID=E6VSL5_PSEA9|nr:MULTISPECIES: nickel ABC transporter permease subunit NikC [Pseudodesulfovibrio]MBU4245293.1 nickel ABC transporter permease subunit NikC [Pseudomonadota bacterium]ADU62000.1 binding-protein-dependent transport systems inner membrane component [Pseudodesulfovibrio aespoeensis Aspo-2]MBU4474923.1 nickel ABC transporter permease subunit NikC [Pseudomonadota bacterium]MBU4516030.1 nickel ABC transporter permease subunit NikC [Pseudomonadota bacterium]MBU4522768.1 nickel ABC transporter permeas
MNAGDLFRTIRKRGVLVLASMLAVAVIATALFAPVIAPDDPSAVVLENKFAPPSAAHPLGCDHLGRDVLSRLVYGTQTSIGSVAAIMGIVLVLGFTIGTISGYAGGAVDSSLMRFCDVFLTFPTFILAMFLIGVLGTGMVNVIIAVALTHWAWYARIIRSMVLSLKNRDYVLAAKVAGTGRFKTVVRHILPPIIAQLLILCTLDIGHMMLHVSGLSFLGLGVTPPMPEWGVMISDARQFIWTHPLLIMLPGGMIFVTVMAFNLLGDALRDSFDPALAVQEDIR